MLNDPLPNYGSFFACYFKHNQLKKELVKEALLISMQLLVPFTGNT
jgi:hypothetical protein